MEEMKIRVPVVAGQFYPDQRQALTKQISSFVVPKPKGDFLGAILPHAGYIYSGRVAVETAAQLKIKDTVILLGPNHTGSGAAFSVMSRGIWQTPLGEIEIDARLADLFLEKSKLLKNDARAHLDEHSLEVELPILQYFRPDFKIVPITIMSAQTRHLDKLSQEMAQVIKENNCLGALTLIASSDLTHYESLACAQDKDAAVIRAIEDLDELRLKESVESQSISMCGFAPVYLLLRLAKLLGARQGRLVRYATSAEVNHDNASVVGYAGMLIA